MESEENLTGSILVAHPMLRDPNFRRTILFLPTHDESEGATGLVLNRPLPERISPADGSNEVPLFYGGPVQPSHILLASLQWHDSPMMVAFQAFAGKVTDAGIAPQWRSGLRAFAGYAGWEQGQLEAEVADKAWIIVPPTRALIEMTNTRDAWANIMRQGGPLFELMADEPDEPWRN